MPSIQGYVQGCIQASQLGYVAGRRRRWGWVRLRLLHPSFTAWLRCRLTIQGTLGGHTSVASKLHSLATLQESGLGGHGVPELRLHPSFTAWLRCRCSAIAVGERCTYGLHPSFTAWLRCRCSAIAVGERCTYGLHPSFTAWLRCRTSPTAAFTIVASCIQASQLGYVAGGRCGERLQGRAGRCIQASQLGYVAGSSSTPRTGATRTVASKLHSLATLQEVRARGGRLRGGRCIQASQLGYVAGAENLDGGRGGLVASKLHSLATLQGLRGGMGFGG